MIKERPILFSGPMVKAILEGRKTQTRRMVKPQPIEHDGVIECGPAIAGSMHALHQWLIANKCPYGKPGDRLWLREQHRFTRDVKYDYIEFRADGEVGIVKDNSEWLRDEDFERWKPSIHMPRWASRITLEVVSVRVERLQEISEEDAIAEGAERMKHEDIGWHSFRRGYEVLWESINGPGSWEANPWVWVVTFRRIKPE